MMAIIQPYSRSALTEKSVVRQVVNTNTLVYLKLVRIPGIDLSVLINLEVGA